MQYGEYFEHLVKFVGSHVCQINGVGEAGLLLVVVAVLIRNCKSSFLLLKSKVINKTQNIRKSKHDNK